MKRICTGRTKRGLTLVETLVSSALMFFIMVSVYEVLTYGMKFYRLNTAVNDRQRSVLFFLAKLNGVLQNTQTSLVSIDPFVPTPMALVAPNAVPVLSYAPSKGISFCDALNDQGQAELDLTNKLYWHAYDCFFLLPNGQIRFIRKSIVPKTVAPALPQGAAPPGSFTQTDGTLIGTDVTALEFRMHQVGEKQPNGKPLGSAYYDVIVECGTKGDPNGYWIRLSSSVYPRN